MGTVKVTSVAALALKLAGRERDPRHLVVALGLRLLPRPSASPPPRTIDYEWHPDPRVVAHRVARRLAEYLLVESHAQIGPGDVERLARLLNPAGTTDFCDIRKAV